MPSSNPLKCAIISLKDDTGDFAVTFDHLLQIMIPNHAPDILLPFKANTGFYSFIKITKIVHKSRISQSFGLFSGLRSHKKNYSNFPLFSYILWPVIGIITYIM